MEGEVVKASAAMADEEHAEKREEVSEVSRSFSHYALMDSALPLSIMIRVRLPRRRFALDSVRSTWKLGLVPFVVAWS